MRDWTWNNPDAVTDEQIEKLTPLLDDLARQWSILTDTEERQRFDRMARREDGEDYEFDNEGERYAHEQRQRLAERRHAAQLAAIEQMLEEHGARMMRPYEHWNEDEQYMQWMESRYD